MIKNMRWGENGIAMIFIGVLGVAWISLLIHPFPYKAIGSGIWLLLLYGAGIDCKSRRVHDAVPLSIGSLGVIYAVVTAQPLTQWGAGVILNGLIMGLLYLLSRKSVGLGDVKLVTALGLFLGPFKSFYLMFHASWLGALLVVTGLILKKMNKQDEIPFIPFIAAGYLLAISSL